MGQVLSLIGWGAQHPLHFVIVALLTMAAGTWILRKTGLAAISRPLFRLVTRTLRAAVRLSIGVGIGWVGDLPGRVDPNPGIESVDERQAQYAAAIAWPSAGLALIYLGGGSSALGVLVTACACVILGRRAMAARGFGWPRHRMISDAKFWVFRSIYRSMYLGILITLGVAWPLWLAFFHHGETSVAYVPAGACWLVVAGSIANTEARFRQRRERVLPGSRLGPGLGARPDVIWNEAVFRPGSGRKEFQMVGVPADVIKAVEAGDIDRGMADHLAAYEAVPNRSIEFGAIVSITLVPVTLATAERRAALRETNFLLESIGPVPSDSDVRPGEHEGRLARGVTETRAEELDAIVHESRGLSLVAWDKGRRAVTLAMLDERTRHEKNRMIGSCPGFTRPWDFEVSIGWAEDGEVVDLDFPRFPAMVSAAKRREAFLALASSKYPRQAGDDRRWTITDFPGQDRVVLAKVDDPLKTGFTIDDFTDQFREDIDPSRIAFPIARREDGTPLSYNLFHTLVIGQTGAGKGSVFWGIVSGLLPLVRDGLIELYAIDPKFAEAPMAPRLFKNIATTPEEWDPMLEEMVHGPGGMKERQAARAGIARSTPISKKNPARVLLVDEASALKKYETDSERGKRVNANLLLLASQGRSEAYTLVLLTQGPQKDLVGEVREFCPLRIAMRTATRLETDIALGEGAADAGALAHEIEAANPGNGYKTAGIAYMQPDGETVPTRIRFPFTSDEVLKRWDQEFEPVVEGDVEVLSFSLDELELDIVEMDEPTATAQGKDVPGTGDQLGLTDFLDEDLEPPTLVRVAVAAPEEDEFGPTTASRATPPTDDGWDDLFG